MTSHQSNYFGYFIRQDRFADNRALYEEILASMQGRSDDSRVYSLGCTKAKVRQDLDFLKRFSPAQPHSSLVAHQVEVYRYKNLTWREKGKNLLMPCGELEKLLAVDLGEEFLLKAGEQLYREEVVEEEICLPLPDGTFLKGKRVRRVPRSAMESFKEYLLAEFDLSGKEKNGFYAPAYSLELPKPTAEEPREFALTTYVKVDGELCSSEKEMVRPLFLRKENAGGRKIAERPLPLQPGKFKGWVKAGK